LVQEELYWLKWGYVYRAYIRGVLPGEKVVVQRDVLDNQLIFHSLVLRIEGLEPNIGKCLASIWGIIWDLLESG